MQNTEKQFITGLLGNVFFLILAIFSLIFYKERMLYYDPAFFSFSIINNGTFSIALGRFGAMFSQILPVLASKKLFSIDTILQIYSISFILVYYLIFSIIQCFLKDTVAALVLIFSLCLTFGVTFYYPTAELYHGIAFAVLFWSLLRKLEFWNKREQTIGIVFILLLGILLSYLHQLAGFLAVFFIAIQLLDWKGSNRARLLFIGSVFLIWNVIRIKFLTTSTYESDKLLDSSTFMDQLFKLNTNPTLERYFNFLKDVTILPLIAFITALLLLIKKNFKLVSLCILAFIGFSVVVLVTLYRGESIIMTQNYFTVLGTFMAIPITMVIIDYKKIFMVPLVIVLCGYSLFGIYKAAQPLKERVIMIENMIDYGRQFQNKKFIISEKNHLNKYFFSTTFMPFETLLQSSLNFDDESVTYFIQKEGEELKQSELSKEGVFLGPNFSLYSYRSNTFNLNYFRLPLGPYLNLSTNQDDNSYDENLFDKNNLKLESLRLKYDDVSDIYVKLTNLSTQILPSIPGERNKIFLGYHLADKEGKIITWDNERTALDFDLHPNKTMIQKLKVNPPSSPGNYILFIDIVTEGKRWWNIDTKIELRIK